MKVSAFQKRFINQILNYKKDLINLQNDGKLIKGAILPYLLIPQANQNHKIDIENKGVFLQEYNPEKILNHFYDEKLKPITFFTNIKPIDIGIWNIHLIHKFLYYIKKTKSIKDLLKIVGGSYKTLYNKIRFSEELGLVISLNNSDNIELTTLGKEYIDSKDVLMRNTLSEQQAKLLRCHVMKNPYSSNVNLGIASIVECIFSLSKMVYPVPIKYVDNYFCIYVGKSFDWQTDRAKKYGARMYSNYAIELGLIGKNETNFYLTPEGLKFVVQMQLQKSLKIVESFIS